MMKKSGISGIDRVKKSDSVLSSSNSSVSTRIHNMENRNLSPKEWIQTIAAT